MDSLQLPSEHLDPISAGAALAALSSGAKALAGQAAAGVPALNLQARALAEAAARALEAALPGEGPAPVVHNADETGSLVAMSLPEQGSITLTRGPDGTWRGLDAHFADDSSVSLGWLPEGACWLQTRDGAWLLQPGAATGEEELSNRVEETGERIAPNWEEERPSGLSPGVEPDPAAAGFDPGLLLGESAEQLAGWAAMLMRGAAAVAQASRAVSRPATAETASHPTPRPAVPEPAAQAPHPQPEPARAAEAPRLQPEPEPARAAEAPRPQPEPEAARVAEAPHPQPEPASQLHPASDVPATSVPPCPHCLYCQHELPPDGRFCPACGKSAAGHCCPACGGAVAAEARFCQHCGHTLAPARASCSACGRELPAGARFCSHCGTPAPGGPS